MSVERIDIRGICKRYGRHRALADVDLELRRGQLCALLGPNGAGKSTLLGLVSTLIRPSSGEVVFQGSDGVIADAATLRRSMGVLAHEPFVYGQLTATENLEFWGRLYGVENTKDRAALLLDEVGLDSRARERSVSTYSRGMVQRLSLARALLHSPRVLLLDEPFSGLDRGGGAALQKTLLAVKEAGGIIVVVTHNLEAIAAQTDHVVVLRRGRVEFESRANFDYRELSELYHRYSD